MTSSVRLCDFILLFISILKIWTVLLAKRKSNIIIELSILNSVIYLSEVTIFHWTSFNKLSMALKMTRYNYIKKEQKGGGDI